MTSQSLYRKYRPQCFAEVVGQDHITTALRNAVREDRVGHAYLFSGPRGTGKTTTARILAKALNCLDLAADGEPCGTCENCLAVASGTFFDLAELDAASNNGVENVRDLIQSVNLGLGATAKRKVYLIDEVHMLSSAASNALLKTLEEPPSHVVFILATTDPQKVLPTIRSRTQHFDFHLFSVEELSGLLGGVLEQEGIEATPEVLGVIARRGAGSARDSLSLLDQALALGSGTIDGDQVQATFGGTPFDRRLAVLDAAAADDPGGALVAVQQILEAGIEPRRLADDLLATLRDAFVQLASAGKVPYEGPHEDEPKLAALADALGAAGLTRAMDLFGAAIVDIRSPTAPDPRLVLEVAVVRCARRDARTPVDALLDRVSRLEARLDVLASTAPAPPVGRAGVSSVPTSSAGAEVPVDAEVPDRGPLSSNLRRRRADGPGTLAGADAAGSPGGPGSLGDSGGAPASVAAAPESSPTGSPSGSSGSGGSSGLAVEDDATHATSAAAPAEGAMFELDDVILAWGHALGGLSAPVRAAVAEAHPIAVEGTTVVFGVPRVRAEAINKRFRAEADAIKAGLATHLGAVPSLRLRPHDFDAPGALRPSVPSAGPAAAPVAAAATPEPEDVPDVVDLSELVDAPPDIAPVDSASRLLDAFGGEIVEERRRDPS